MDWISTLPALVFWWGWMMVALLAAGSLYATFWARRNVKALAEHKPVDVSDLVEGYRLAWGRTLGPALTSPLTGRSCVWWRAEVWESVRDRDAHGKFRHVWRQIAEEESDRPILFGDERQAAAVWTYGATVLSSSWSDWKGQQLPPEDRFPALHSGGSPPRVSEQDIQGTFGPRFRYVERIIAPGSPIFALAEASPADPTLYAVEDDSENPDDDGWRPEPSRLGVTPTQDSVVAKDMERAAWTISARKGKPFLVSIEHPEAVSAEQELGAKGGLIMGAIFTGLCALLLWLRYGG